MSFVHVRHWGGEDRCPVGCFRSLQLKKGGELTPIVDIGAEGWKAEREKEGRRSKLFDFLLVEL